MDLDAVNEYLMRTSLWPAVVFTVFMMLIGTVGNALVLIIYRNDFHKSVTWIFIYFLSVLDICTCLISMPSELTILFNMVSFPSWPWCKISRYLSYIFHGSSCVILMAIAFNRYDRVCRSASQYVNIKKAKLVCLGVVIFAAVINIPSLILYGEATVPILIRENTAKIISNGDVNRSLDLDELNRTETTISNAWKGEVINGSMCLIKSEYAESPFTMAFFFVQFLMYATLVVLVIYFYSKVIRKMVGYRAKQERLFKLYVPVKRDSVKEEDDTSTNHPLSEDVKSDTLCKDVTTDPLSQSIQNPKEADGNTAKRKKDVEKKEKHTAVLKPVTIADVSQKNTNGRPDITFPVSDVKNAGSDGLSENFNPIQANKLLSRRIKSVETLSKAFTTIPTLVVPNIDINQNSKTPLFLHANKTHKKRGTYESDKRDDRMCTSDEQVLLSTQDDLYLHKERQNYGYGSKSLEVLSPSNIDPLNLADKTMTINRKSPKGSMKCVLPISGLSVKSATSYSHEELSKEPEDDANPSLDKSESDEKTNASNSASETHERKSKDEQCVEPKQIASVKKKLVTQPSVTFSIAEEENPSQGRSKSRPSHLDSVSPMFDTPQGDDKLPPMRRSRSDSLLSPSNKTVGYNRRMSIKPIKALRTSSMLLIISLAFVFSFLPFWVIVLLRSAVGGGFTSSLTPTTFGVVSVFIRSSLVSNAVNPIVYGLLNSQFRKRCKAIILRR